MKTFKNIYPKIYAYENLHAAWRKAARGKRKSPEVAGFEYHLIDNLLQLEEELRTQSYRPGPYRHFYLREPKLRRISADLGYINLEQQRHAGQMLAEIGKMLGSWQKKN